MQEEAGIIFIWLKSRHSSLFSLSIWIYRHKLLSFKRIVFHSLYSCPLCLWTRFIICWLADLPSLLTTSFPSLLWNFIVVTLLHLFSYPCYFIGVLLFVTRILPLFLSGEYFKVCVRSWQTQRMSLSNVPFLLSKTWIHSICFCRVTDKSLKPLKGMIGHEKMLCGMRRCQDKHKSREKTGDKT